MRKLIIASEKLSFLKSLNVLMLSCLVSFLFFTNGQEAFGWIWVAISAANLIGAYSSYQTFKSLKRAELASDQVMISFESEKGSDTWKLAKVTMDSDDESLGKLIKELYKRSA